MTEPEWDRWHELLDLRDRRGLTVHEQAEYDVFLMIVKRKDEEDDARCAAFEAKWRDRVARLTGVGSPDEVASGHGTTKR